MATDSLSLLPLVDLSPEVRIATPLPELPDYDEPAGHVIATAKAARKAARKARGGANGKS
ncbi:MAG TPA: hypothetical protein VIY51_15520 [Xanthobacteraceae bacterium]